MNAKIKTPPTAPTASAPQEQPTLRNIPEVDAKIDTYIRENPKYFSFLQTIPRDRLERMVVLNEVRELDRQQRMQNGVMRRINSNPNLKTAYETLVKDVPEDQREEVMAQMARQKQRVVARSQSQHQTNGETVGI
jgi:predicted ATP-dependent protease